MSAVIVEPDLIVRPLTLDKGKVNWLWEQCCQFRTLFSDLTKGDYDNFIALLMEPDTVWFEVIQPEPYVPAGGPNGDVNCLAKEALLGLVWLTDIKQVVDANCHMMFFDRRAEADNKIEVCKQLIRWCFLNMPFQRLTAPIPELYRGTRRIAERLGFTHEGTKRRALLMDGRWVNLRIYGITRPEVLG